METMTLLIADSSEEFRNNLINALQGNYRIQSCQTGKEALEILRNATPDLLIMDLMLPELDGLTLLQVLSDSVDGNAEALMGLWSSQEAGKAANAIMTQGIEDFNAVVAQMDKEMSGATGTTEQA